VLTHDRTFRRAIPPEAAIAEISRYRGTQFDPKVVDAIIKLFAQGALAAIDTAEFAV
jgi:HD-GYP domain-containing protein (c-di-GMP phosphodiesterase class II)